MLKNSKAIKYIIIAVVLLIPVIYSFFYLKAYWDPYGNLKDVSVAMVNLDEGTRGAELIKSMQEAENTLGFTEVSYDDAIKGLEVCLHLLLRTWVQSIPRQPPSSRKKSMC